MGGYESLNFLVFFFSNRSCSGAFVTVVSSLVTRGATVRVDKFCRHLETESSPSSRVESVPLLYSTLARVEGRRRQPVERRYIVSIHQELACLSVIVLYSIRNQNRFVFHSQPKKRALTKRCDWLKTQCCATHKGYY